MIFPAVQAFQRSKWWIAGAPAVLIAVSVGVQASRLAASGFWVDEAESTINALTILEHGYPTDSYLGIPIFENMLVRPWPDHPEYEFKDVSYSDRGMAIYHGWLPLYAIAASLKLFAVKPATPSTGWQIGIDLDRYRLITLAARVPSLLFFAAFLPLIFFAGKGLANRDAAMAVLALASLSSSVVGPAISARYYAPMLALSALGALTLWRVVQRGRVADHAAHAAVLVALFYSHLIVFAALVLLTVVMIALYQRTTSAVRRLTTSLFVVAAGCAPWLLSTGYLQHLGQMPSGFSMVRLPDDLLHYVFNRMPYLLLFSAGGIWLALAWIRHGAALPDRLREPWLRHRKQYSMLLLWMSIATAIYYLASPPASLFPQRLSLSLYVPGFLFMAMTMADASRTVSRSLAFLMTPGLALPLLHVGN